MSEQKALWGWYPAGNVWVKLQVDATGKLVVDATAIFEEPPTNGEMGKAATSNWSFDHNADPNAHHAAFTAADHLAIGDAAPHHPQAHTLASHTTKAHAELTGIGADDHHARQHAISAAADHTGRIALSQMTLGGAGLVLTGQGAGDPTYAAGGGDPGEGHITILPYNYNAIVQGTWTFALAATEFFNGFYANGGGALNDEINYKVYLAAGTYTIAMLGRQQAVLGKSEILIDATSVATFDWYAAATTYNVRQTDTGNVIATSGLKTLTIKMSSTNPLSGLYILRFQSIALWRTA